MDDYIEKMQELLSNGYSNNEVAENLYLNYHSVINTDEVYKLRKAIAEKYKCNLNDVKLIGSSHTGYAYKKGKLLKRENPQDYDFAIIDVGAFVRFFHMVNADNITNTHEKSLYVKDILNGKLHPLHADSKFRERLEKINQSIMNELNVSKHVSICFYLSEKDFVDGLVKYNCTLYSGELRKLSIRRSNEMIELQNLTDIKTVDEMEGKGNG